MKIRAQHFHTHSAFTMIEVAISLAIIGIALVGIIGVLPIGLHTQRDNREDTIINQDATVFMDAIGRGARGLDDLTNYVYAITNSRVFYVNGSPTISTLGYDANFLTTGARIVGLMSTPEYTDVPGDPIGVLNGNGVSNHVVAYVRSISGPAVEKPPQNNQILQQDSFSYRVFCVNAPIASSDLNSTYANNLQANLHELRLTFLWPALLPNGTLPPSPAHATYRALVAGQITSDKSNNSAYLYFYQPQSFTNAPTPP